MPFWWGWNWGWGWGWGWGENWNWDWDGYWHPAFVLFLIVVFLAVIAVGFLVQFFFLRNLRDLLNRVGPQNRAMPPGHVWLNFIPIFGFGWTIYTVIKVRDSVRAEYWSRGWRQEGDLGYGVGMAFAILGVAGWVLGRIPFRSLIVISSLVGLGGLVCWIIYWVKTNSLKNRLGEAMAARGRYPSRPGAYPGGPGASAPPSGPALRCSRCGSPYDPGDRFCRSCGQPTPPDTGLQCASCDAAAEPDDVFCRSCGSHLN